MHLRRRLFRSFFVFLFGSSVAFSGSQPRELELLKKITLIPSGSENADGVNSVQKVAEETLKDLGFSVQHVPNPNAKVKSGYLLLATRKGKDPRFVTLLAHADTVFERSSGFDSIVIKEDKLVGPGVGDDKGGLIVALSGLERYLKGSKAADLLYSFRVIVTPSEEVGSPGFHDLFRDWGKDSFMVLGFEPNIAGSVINSRRGNRWYDVRVKGRESHAADTFGVNACLELSAKLVQISKLNNPSKEITVNIGHIEGGKDKFNITCGEASAKIDTRFPDSTSAKNLAARIESILKQKILRAPDGKTAVTVYSIADESPAFPPTAVAEPYLKTYMRIVSDIEKRPILARLSVGSADSNYFFRDGLILIDGLGPSGQSEHTNKEWISISSLSTRAEALARFLAELKD